VRDPLGGAWPAAAQSLPTMEGHESDGPGRAAGSGPVMGGADGYDHRPNVPALSAVGAQLRASSLRWSGNWGVCCAPPGPEAQSDVDIDCGFQEPALRVMGFSWWRSAHARVDW